MKNNFNHYLEEGLRIVDEDGVSFQSEEENQAIHQEMQDLNIDDASELAAARYEQKWLEFDFYVFGKINPYGAPVKLPYYLFNEHQ